MYYYLYKIVNLENQKYYIGRRQSKVEPEKDPYMGSGKLLKKSMKKGGSFKKIILSLYKTEEELIEAEKTAITEEMIASDMCYNISVGGHGGYTDYSNRNYTPSLETRRKLSEQRKGVPRPHVSQQNYETGFNKWWDGKKRSEEDRKNKSIAAKNSKGNPFRKVAKCPHCGKEGQLTNMKRWHFENCKHKHVI